MTGVNKDKGLATNSEVVPSNTKIEWGIQRKNNHEQPDLGYEAGHTEKILDALKENNVQAAFFITAHYVNTAGDLVKRMIDENHVVRQSHHKS